MAAVHTHYDVLQIAETASPEVIKGAYKFLAQKWHPDKNLGNREEAQRTTRLINEAYAVLSDPKRRQEYDQWLRLERERGAGARERDYVPPATTTPSVAVSRQPGLIKRVWLMLLFVASLAMILGVFPYQLVTGGFEWIYLGGLAFWVAAGYYAYTTLFQKTS